MIDLINITQNKISTDLNSYPIVMLGATGDGKTQSMFNYLTSVAPVGKVPLFLEFEDRYKSIPDITAVRIYSIPDILVVLNQLCNPETRAKFSCVVIDTADKFEEMANRYIANSKGVEITEELGFGKGKRYLNAQIGILTEIRNLGLPVHFCSQLYEKIDIIKKKTSYQTKLNEVTKAQLFHDAFLVGYVSIDNRAKDPISADRIISFRKTDTYPDLKDTFGLPTEMKVAEIKTILEKHFKNKYRDEQITNCPTIELIEKPNDFDTIKKRGMEIGSKLVEAGLLEETTNVLATTIGVNDDGSAKMFNTLVESQYDLAKVIVLKLEELASKNNVSV